MSKFFNAPATRAAMAEIQELQEDIMTGIAVRGMNQPTTEEGHLYICLLYTSPSPRDRTRSRMPSSA